MAKKSFLTEGENPALSFISAESVEAVEKPARPAENPPAGYKRNPEFIEKRTKRVQLVLQPSLYEAAKGQAAELGISFNDYIHRVLTEALQGDKR